LQINVNVACLVVILTCNKPISSARKYTAPYRPVHALFLRFKQSYRNCL